MDSDKLAKNMGLLLAMKPTHDYIGIKPCGCVVVVIADIPGTEKATAREVAGMIREGLKVERIPIADLSKYLPLGCKHVSVQMELPQ